VNQQLSTNHKLFAKLRSKESSTSVDSDVRVANLCEENRVLNKKVEEL
jgi:hypothetical protein